MIVGTEWLGIVSLNVNTAKWCSVKISNVRLRSTWTLIPLSFCRLGMISSRIGKSKLRFCC